MIVLKDVEKTLGTFRLCIERLEMRAGEYLVVLGPSGAGKTVLLLTAAGLLPLDAGEIFFNSINVTKLPPEKRDVGLVFQEANLFPHLNVLENISFGKRYRRKRSQEIEKRIEVLVDMLNIGHLLQREVAGLSGGEKQRVAVARALSLAPGILLMDEPLGLLDQNTREEMRKELRRVHDELGATTLHVTHDRNEAFTVADRIAILNDGRLAQIASREEIFTRPVTEFVARFIGVENILEGVVEQDATGKAFVRIAESRVPVESSHRGKVRACIRPEAISIHAKVPSGAKEAGLIPGTIKAAEDKGAAIRLVVACSVGEIVVICGKQEFAGSGISCSSPVWLEPEASAIHVIPSSE